ncbi:MAG: hypothetical protein ABII06_02160 [Pseudomonadota bacterium]
MKSEKNIKHILINLYCRVFGGESDILEVWDGPNYNYLVMRKEDGWVTTISRTDVDAYLSDDRPMRERARTAIIARFHQFKQSEDG